MKIKCKKCGGEFDCKMFKLHVNNSHKNDFTNDNELELFVLTNRFGLFDETIEEIICDYKNDSSILSLVSKYKIPHKSLSVLLKLKGVEIKSFSEVAKHKSVRDKYITTCLNSHGVNNVSKLNVVKSQKIETFKKNYGVDNIFKTNKFKASLNEVMLNKYGVKRISGWFSLTDEQKEETIKRLHSGSISNLEKRVGNILLDLGIKIQSQFRLKSLTYDYWLVDSDLLLEVNGDFWHGNPSKYKSNDLLKFPKNPVLVKDLWSKDEKKIKTANSNGYKVITLWEKDINKYNDMDLGIFILEQIKNNLNGD